MLQSDIIDFLNRPESYGLALGQPVLRFDTHISVVFVVGEYAYKLKRALQLPFVDFRSLASRQKFCKAELDVNQNAARGIYLDVIAVTLDKGQLSLNGEGEPVEWLVKMHRFEQSDLFEHLCEQGELSIKDMERLTDYLSNVYKKASVDHAYGGVEGMERAFQGHYKAFENCPEYILSKDHLKQLSLFVAEQIKQHSSLLNDRRETGFVRHCHGDLHLRNICLFNGEVALFDGIEFEPDYAIIDVLYDLSFLIMDLCHRGFEGLANAVLNRYLGLTGDVAGLHLLPLFLSSRSAIRTHVNAVASANQKTDQARLVLEEDAQTYLKESLQYLSPIKPVLIAIGGLSGTGKSVLAKKLAPNLGVRPGAYIARTDMIRKRLMGAHPEEKLNPYGYSKGVTSHTYNTLYVEMRLALHAGYCVIVDGVFAKEEERQTLEDIAKAMVVPFVGLWLNADQEVLENRVEKRVGDVSDADVIIVQMQAEYDVGALNWHLIETKQPLEAVYEKAMEILKENVAFNLK